MILATFKASVSRPKPTRSGMQAEFFAYNGSDADAVLPLGRTAHLDGKVRVDMADEDAAPLGSFEAFLRRPKPHMAGMIACFFGENGAQADAITALSLSRFQDQKISITVTLLQMPDGSEVKSRPVGPFKAQATALWLSDFMQRPEVWDALGGKTAFDAWVGANESSGGLLKSPAERQKQWIWETMLGDLHVRSMDSAAPEDVRIWAEERGISQLLPTQYREGTCKSN